MSMTDPVADLLTRIRNGYRAKQDKVDVPASRLKANIVKVLRDEGYLDGFKLVREEGRAWIKVQLKYDDGGEGVIKGIRRVSRPGLRRYVGCEDVARIRSGAGVAIVSTSKGVMTGQRARASRVGGEYLCEVW
ncbi:MAG: 30S ribosomal protein S8 [Deltaproteobacteria bacterium]|nr:30S ribosomal protein S8 [Deltaproteobacteria bacterium]